MYIVLKFEKMLSKKGNVCQTKIQVTSQNLNKITLTYRKIRVSEIQIIEEIHHTYHTL